MNYCVAFLIIAASALASAGAGGVGVAKDGGRVEVRALPACDDGAPALEFIIYNEWEEDVKVTRNWLLWNSSPWFEIKIDGIEQRSLPSLSRYREDNYVLLRSGEHMSGTIRVDRLFPNKEIPVPTVMR